MARRFQGASHNLKAGHKLAMPKIHPKMPGAGNPAAPAPGVGMSTGGVGALPGAPPMMKGGGRKKGLGGGMGGGML